MPLPFRRRSWPRLFADARMAIAYTQRAGSGHQIPGTHQTLRETLRNRNPEAFDEKFEDEFEECDYD